MYLPGLGRLDFKESRLDLWAATFKNWTTFILLVWKWPRVFWRLIGTQSRLVDQGVLYMLWLEPRTLLKAREWRRRRIRDRWTGGWIEGRVDAACFGRADCSAAFTPSGQWCQGSRPLSQFVRLPLPVDLSSLLRFPSSLLSLPA